jgi:hypothetical protein
MDKQLTRGLAGAAEPSGRPLYAKPEAHLFAARIMAEADGTTLTAIREAALAFKSGQPEAARRLVYGIVRR